MTAFPRPVADHYQLYELTFAAGGAIGSRHVWAIDETGARGLLTRYPSSFGISHETVHILKAERLIIREQGVLAPDERQHDRRAA